MKPVRWILVGPLLLVLLMGCTSASTSPEPPVISHVYTATNAAILNPERGFFTPYELPGRAGFSPVRATGNTLVHLNIRLDKWRETDLPQDLLDGLDSNFADIRAAGVKAILRFAYNQGPFPDSEPDASKSQILRHIEQLTPLLQKNADVIAWLEAGFIGAWGEWHTSTHGLDNLTDKGEILSTLLAAVPNRYVQVRYPANIIELYPEPMDAALARVAHHNDCFLSSATDVGTYERDGVVTIERDMAYLADLTRLTPMSGETCAPNPPRSECASAMQEMEELHFSAINEAYHKGIIRSWAEGGCLAEINDRLGYRLVLTTADFNEQVRPGGLLQLSVQLENSGFAAPMNPRTVYVVLQEPNSIFLTGLALDPRMWQPGQASFSVSLRLPSRMKKGEYNLALWLPDAAETLRDNPLYAVQFANVGVWDEATGYNVLGIVNVDQAASGDYQQADFLQAEDLVSEVVPATAPTPGPALLAESAGLVSNVWISNDLESLKVTFDYAGTGYNAFQLFIDQDQAPTTGYTLGGIGAEMLFENITWNIYDGTGTDWKWQPTELAVHFLDTGGHVEWQISRSLLQTSTFDLVLQLVDQNWNSAFITPKASYTLQ